MESFLHSIARAYMSRYRDMSDFCFVFPNKRSGTFFLNELRRESRRGPIVAPEVTSISNLAEELSGRVLATRMDLLFLLYLSYCRMIGRQPEDEEGNGMSFDSFRQWGEIALSDFNEVDMYGVDPDEIFKNLKDYREIASNFLTQEQRNVMREYLGYESEPSEDEARFWKSFEPVDDLTELKRRFLELWQVMSPLYHNLQKELDKRGLTTEGGSYRLTRDRLAEGSVKLPWRKMVFIGFNALSLMEREIFTLLKEQPGYPGPEGEEPYVDFFWDGTGEILSGSGDNSASKFLRLNRRDYPSPEWAADYIHSSDAGGIPESLRVINAPSNAIQAKIAGEVLGKWRAEVSSEEIRDARLAVVLPDESLLLPLLYSLPEGLESVNLTMGYPLRLTTTISFITLYRKLQIHVKPVNGVYAFYHRDLRRVLSHPFTHAVVGSREIADLRRYLDRTHIQMIGHDTLMRVSQAIGSFLVPIPPRSGSAEAAGNIVRTLTRVVEALSPENGEGEGGLMVIKEKLDISNIGIYLDTLRSLVSAIDEHHIRLSSNTFFLLADRLLASTQVRFEGEPLQGLQIMGMLETRALDFDRIIIPSVNERILPMKGRTRSFIPNSLRAAYQMPPTEHQENLAAYYFYRLISRAREVVMIYDGRSGAGLHSGDISRYIFQLQYLYAPGKIRFEDRHFNIVKDSHPLMEIEKRGAIAEMLKGYFESGSKARLSASTLETYCQCGIRFFFEKLAGLKTDTAPSEYMDAKTQGDVVHEVMQHLYISRPNHRKQFLTTPLLITKELIEGLLRNRSEIERQVRRSINKRHYGLDNKDLDRALPGTSGLVAPYIVEWIRRILRHDLQYAPFNLYGCEIEENLMYPLGDGRKVQFRFVIDRLDEITLPDGSRRIRIVDYKTGNKVCMEVDDATLDSFIEGYSRMPGLQLLLYAELFNCMLGKMGKDSVDFMPVIYHVPKMGNRIATTGDKRKDSPEKYIMVDGEVVTHIDQVPEVREVKVSDEFRTSLREKLVELFDSGVPFKAAASSASCSYCSLKMLCGR